MKRITATIIAGLAALGGPALAAPPLDPAMAANANPLQRAVWACEAGAPSLAPAKGHTRFFLASAGADGAAEPPLNLTATRLTGTGLLSDDRGWSVILYACTISFDLRQARAFTFSVVRKQTAPSATPPVSATTNARRVWGSDGHILTHGVPETDDRDFRADCSSTVGKVDVSLSNTVSWLKAGGRVTVTLGDGRHSALYVATGTLNEESGAPMPEFTVSADDPLFAWMAAGKTLLINIGGDLAYAVPLTGSASSLRAFTVACRG